LTKRRFFYHYRRCDKQMSVHFKGHCLPCQNVECRVPCETHRQKRQPFLVMRGFASTVRKEGDTVVIE
jgi:hypothetical protein